MRMYYLDVGHAPDLPPTAATPEGRMWASALALAIHDASCGSNTLDYRSAIRWLRDTAERRGSVRWVCDILNIHHDRVLAAIGACPTRRSVIDRSRDVLNPLPMKFLYEEFVEHIVPRYNAEWCRHFINTAVRYELLKRTPGARRGLDVLEKIYEHDHEPVTAWVTLKGVSNAVID